MANKETKRLGNITTHQKEVMIEYLKKHPQLLAGKFSQNFSKIKAQDMWKELTELLNSLGGAKKEWFQWRKTWHDMRTHTKSKKAALTKHRRGTGGGSPAYEDDNLTETEEAIAEMMGTTVIEGDQEVIEPKVDFDFNSGPEFITIMVNNEAPGSPELCYKENSSPNVSAGSSALGKSKTASQPVITPKSVQIPKMKNPQSNSKPPSKRLRQLQHTMEASERLVVQQDQHLEVIRNYYRRKIELMEEDIAVKRDIGNSLKLICTHLFELQQPR